MNLLDPTMQERRSQRSRYSARPIQWFLTRHALKRMREMGVERGQVVTVLNDPEVRYPDRYGHFIACHGPLAVCFTGDTVITVLWRGLEFVREGY